MSGCFLEEVHKCASGLAQMCSFTLVKQCLITVELRLKFNGSHVLKTSFDAFMSTTSGRLNQCILQSRVYSKTSFDVFLAILKGSPEFPGIMVNLEILLDYISWFYSILVRDIIHSRILNFLGSWLTWGYFWITSYGLLHIRLTHRTFRSPEFLGKIVNLDEFQVNDLSNHPHCRSG